MYIYICIYIYYKRLRALLNPGLEAMRAQVGVGGHLADARFKVSWAVLGSTLVFRVSGFRA